MNGHKFWKTQKDMGREILALHVRGNAASAHSRELYERFWTDLWRVFKRMQELSRTGSAQRTQFCAYVAEFVVSHLYECFFDSRDDDLFRAVDTICTRAHLVLGSDADPSLIREQLFKYGASVADQTTLSVIMAEAWKCPSDVDPDCAAAHLTTDRRSVSDPGKVVVETAS